MKTTIIPFGAGLIGSGLVCLAFGDFILSYQPVPPDIPARTLLAYLNGLLLTGLGFGLFVPKFRLNAVRALVLYGFVWTIVLKVPTVIARPSSVFQWLGLAEVLSLALASLMLALMLDPEARTAARQWCRRSYALCPLIFGLSHFVYIAAATRMVPDWAPFPMFWAYATGVGHFLSGLALASGILARPAARLLALMMGSFALLIHLPDVVLAPLDHGRWTMLFIATSLAGAAWIFHRSLPPQDGESVFLKGCLSRLKG